MLRKLLGILGVGRSTSKSAVSLEEPRKLTTRERLEGAKAALTIWNHWYNSSKKKAASNRRRMDLYWRGSSKYKTHASDWSNNMRQAKLYKKKIREAERKIDTLTFQLAFEERREEVENERPSV